MSNIITVHTENPYDILIGNGVLSQCAAKLQTLRPHAKLAIITDDIVDSLYAKQIETSLLEAGFCVCKYVFPHGEASKSLKTAEKIYAFLVQHQMTRSDLILALGGGVVGDLAGFVASTYLRGMDFVQIPTTFLAMIDSSVGGKTAVNIPAGKNLVGAFHQPILVLCDPNTLSTLSNEIFSEGTAEAIKYGMILDRDLFDLLASDMLYQQLESVIETCIRLKATIVEKDEKDTGERMILNFGHTLGHCIEKSSDFSIAHGRAVAIGMAWITKASEQKGLSSAGMYQALCKVLSLYGLPTDYACDPNDLCQIAQADKKRLGSNLSLIICDQIGHAVLHQIEAHHLFSFLQES